MPVESLFTLGLVLLWSGLNHASMTIATELTKGTFQRMIIAPVSPTTVLLGKFISNLVLVYLSGFIMLISEVLLFQVKPVLEHTRNHSGNLLRCTICHWNRTDTLLTDRK